MTTRGHALSRVSVALSIAMLLAGCGDAVTSAPTTRQFKPVVSHVAVPTTGEHVFLLNGSVPADFAGRVAAAGGTILSSMNQIGVVVTNGLSDADATAIAGKNDVTPDFEGTWVPSPDEMQITAASLSTPVDVTSARPPLAAQFLPQQWNMFQIHAVDTWVAGKTGIPSVKVAILDSGLDPDHLDQMGLIDVANSTAFVPSTKGPPAWADDFFHGTFVGAIVTSNNFGVAGVAPNVTLMAVKVLGANGIGSVGAIIAGIVYATDHGANVINMSLGLDLPKHVKGASLLISAFNRAVNYAKSHGVLVVSAAGNDTLDLQHGHDFVSLPCEAGVQLCVSATANGDLFASYSNYGTNAIDVAAPGGDGNTPTPAAWIRSACSSHSALPILAVCKNGRTYVLIGFGTSFAAPHVSGLGALLDSQFGGQLNAAQMITSIQQGADDLGKPGADPFFGKGRINVYNTVVGSNP
jgi:subtilisin family serine protease